MTTSMGAHPTNATPARRAGARAPVLGARPSRWSLGLPFLALHIACLTAVFTGWSATALALFAVSYLARAFGITAFYHRCLAHRSFRARRSVQFVGATLGASAAQRGPLWWVAHHREHHLYTDRPGDPHSPVVDGFAYSHLLWIFDPANAATRLERVADLARFPELVFLDRFQYLAPGALLGACAGLGAGLELVAPGLHAGPLQLAVWGFVLPTVALYHSTFAVNSLAHRFGRRRFETRDSSRNNWFIAALVLGEGWHNNHHRFPNSARQGLAWYELDPTWWGIRLMARARLVSDLRLPSPSAVQPPQAASGGPPSRAPQAASGGPPSRAPQAASGGPPSRAATASASSSARLPL